MDGIFFDGQGPMMSGTWQNPDTGDYFTVQDSYFEDNQLIIKTTDGRMLDYNIIQNYIKVDKPMPKPEQKPVREELPAEVLKEMEGPDDGSGILADDMALISGHKPVSSLGNLHNTPEHVVVAEQKSTETIIIDKALGKKAMPEVKAGIDWAMPEKEIEMLMTMMDIPVEAITNWYVQQINIDAVRVQVIDAIKKSIADAFAPKPQMIVEKGPIEPQPVQEKPKKARKPKKTE